MDEISLVYCFDLDLYVHIRADDRACQWCHVPHRKRKSDQVRILSCIYYFLGNINTQREYVGKGGNDVFD